MFIFSHRFSIEILIPLVLFDIFLSRTSLLASCLAARPLVYMGTISYGLYVYHGPLLEIAKYNNVSPLGRWSIVLIAAPALAAASYHLMERPVMQLKKYFRPDSRATPAAVHQTPLRLPR